MYSVVNTAVLRGMDSVIVQVEADVCDGLPSFEMVGVPASEVREARERVRSALRSLGYRLPPKKVTVNLSPADIPKRGTGFDLPIALAVLSAYGLLESRELSGTLFAGEVTLSGCIRGVRGILPMVLCAREAGFARVVVPQENQVEAGLVKEITILPAKHLKQVIRWLCGEEVLTAEDIIIEERGPQRGRVDFARFRSQERAEVDFARFRGQERVEVDFAQIRGQHLLKAACQVAAAGRHNLLMSGPPGSGKTMAARAIAGILPGMTEEEQLQLARIYSVSGRFRELKPGRCLRPFRSPHYSVTRTALIGGGRIPQMGEISLAHNGVLFLDELTEFARPVLEQLRQPLEEREVRLVRLGGTYTYPADFMLVAAMNPCSCGFYPDRNRCSCSDTSIRQHLQKLSRPLLDRIDLTVEAPRVTMEELESGEESESSEQIRSRVEAAHELQRYRYRQEAFSYNSQIPVKLLAGYCNLKPGARALLGQSYERLALSARAYHRLMRVSRTIADLKGCEAVEEEHVMEAFLYRSLGDALWRETP